MKMLKNLEACTAGRAFVAGICSGGPGVNESGYGSGASAADAAIYAAELELDSAIEALQHAPKAAAEALDEADNLLGLAYGDARFKRASHTERKMLKTLDTLFLSDGDPARASEDEEMQRFRALAWGRPYRTIGLMLGNAFRLAESILPSECESFEEFCVNRGYVLRSVSFNYALVCFLEYIDYVTGERRGGGKFLQEDHRQLLIDINLTVIEADMLARHAFSVVLRERAGCAKATNVQEGTDKSPHAPLAWEKERAVQELPPLGGSGQFAISEHVLTAK